MTKKLLKKFSKYIKPEFLKSIIDKKEIPLSTELKSAYLEIAIVNILGSTPEDISQKLSLVNDIAFEHDGMVNTIISSLVIITYGMSPLDNAEKHIPLELITTLQEELKEDIKIVVLKGPGHFGNIGGSLRFNYTFIHPDFPEALAKINSVPPGSVEYI